MGHNIPSVISDIQGVQKDLWGQMRRRVARQMRILEADARTHIKRDADWRGKLARSLSMDVRSDSGGPTLVVSVGGENPNADYAPYVEFGTGSRTEETTNRAPTTGLIMEPGSYPPSWPYDAPGMSPGLVANIISWVETKPVEPDDPNMTDEELGYLISSVIAEEGTYAHPFLRPAWFENERQIRQAARTAIRKATS